MKEEWTKRGEMPSICVCFPGAAVLSEENLEGVLREQASSREINVGWLGWLSQRVSLMSVCALVPQVLRVYLWCGESCGESGNSLGHAFAGEWSNC